LQLSWAALNNTLTLGCTKDYNRQSLSELVTKYKLSISDVPFVDSFYFENNHSGDQSEK